MKKTIIRTSLPVLVLLVVAHYAIEHVLLSVSVLEAWLREPVSPPPAPPATASAGGKDPPGEVAGPAGSFREVRRRIASALNVKEEHIILPMLYVGRPSRISIIFCLQPRPLSLVEWRRVEASGVEMWPFPAWSEDEQARFDADANGVPRGESLRSWPLAYAEFYQKTFGPSPMENCHCNGQGICPWCLGAMERYEGMMAAHAGDAVPEKRGS